MNDEREFTELVAAVVGRFLTQNGLAPLAEAEVVALARELSVRPAGAVDAGELPEAVVEAGVARLLAALTVPRPELAGLMKQVLKGCHQPDVGRCRESYRETDSKGRCRRQEWERVLGRVSGTHCVDCPHWRGWEPAEHAERLAEAWVGGAVEFSARRSVYLPEDFRKLRLAASRKE